MKLNEKLKYSVLGGVLTIIAFLLGNASCVSVDENRRFFEGESVFEKIVVKDSLIITDNENYTRFVVRNGNPSMLMLCQENEIMINATEDDLGIMIRKVENGIEKSAALIGTLSDTQNVREIAYMSLVADGVRKTILNHE